MSEKQKDLSGSDSHDRPDSERVEHFRLLFSRLGSGELNPKDAAEQITDSDLKGSAAESLQAAYDEMRERGRGDNTSAEAFINAHFAWKEVMRLRSLQQRLRTDADAEERRQTEYITREYVPFTGRQKAMTQEFAETLKSMAVHLHQSEDPAAEKVVVVLLEEIGLLYAAIRANGLPLEHFSKGRDILSAYRLGSRDVNRSELTHLSDERYREIMYRAVFSDWGLGSDLGKMILKGRELSSARGQSMGERLKQELKKIGLRVPVIDYDKRYEEQPDISEAIVTERATTTEVDTRIHKVDRAPFLFKSGTDKNEILIQPAILSIKGAFPKKKG